MCGCAGEPWRRRGEGEVLHPGRVQGAGGQGKVNLISLSLLFLNSTDLAIIKSVLNILSKLMRVQLNLIFFTLT